MIYISKLGITAFPVEREYINKLPIKCNNYLCK